MMTQASANAASTIGAAEAIADIAIRLQTILAECKQLELDFAAYLLEMPILELQFEVESRRNRHGNARWTVGIGPNSAS